LKANEEPGLQEKANTQAGESSGTLSSDNGRDELDRARQYLSGEGVPKSSWMASQLLWKAIGKQNSDAVLLLSDLYARGDGVPRSCEQARILLVTAAKKGSPAAAQKLRSIENGCR
jgi:TPR repeat protein